MQETGFIGLSTVIIGAWLVFFLAACFVPAMACSHVLARHKSPLHAHLARQLCALQMWLALAQFVLLAALAVVVPFIPGMGVPFDLNAALLAPELAFLGTVLAVSIPAGGKNLRKRPQLLIIITCAQTACFWGALALFAHVFITTLSPANSQLAALLNSATALPIPWLPAGLPLPARLEFTGLIWLSGPALAGGMSLVWLLIRRQTDDFGRDYYNFAARSCASFAAGGGLLCILVATAFCGMLISLFAMPIQTMEGLPAAQQVLLPGWLNEAGSLLYSLLGTHSIDKLGLTTALPGLGLLCLCLPILGGGMALLWFLAARGAVPMRYKGTISFALLLAVVAVSLCSLLFGLAQTLLVSTGA